MDVKLTVVKQVDGWAVIRRNGDGLPHRITYQCTEESANNIAWREKEMLTNQNHNVSVTIDCTGV